MATSPSAAKEWLTQKQVPNISYIMPRFAKHGITLEKLFNADESEIESMLGDDGAKITSFVKKRIIKAIRHSSNTRLYKIANGIEDPKITKTKESESIVDQLLTMDVPSQTQGSVGAPHTSYNKVNSNNLSLIELLKENFDNISNAVAHTQETMHDFKKANMLIENEINIEFERIINVINEKKQNLLQDIKNIQESQTKVLNNQYETLKDYRQNISKTKAQLLSMSSGNSNDINDESKCTRLVNNAISNLHSDLDELTMYSQCQLVLKIDNTQDLADDGDIIDSSIDDDGIVESIESYFMPLSIKINSLTVEYYDKQENYDTFIQQCPVLSLTRSNSNPSSTKNYHQQSRRRLLIQKNRQFSQHRLSLEKEKKQRKSMVDLNLNNYNTNVNNSDTNPYSSTKGSNLNLTNSIGSSHRSSLRNINMNSTLGSTNSVNSNNNNNNNNKNGSGRRLRSSFSVSNVVDHEFDEKQQQHGGNNDGYDDNDDDDYDDDGMDLESLQSSCQFNDDDELLLKNVGGEKLCQFDSKYKTLNILLDNNDTTASKAGSSSFLNDDYVILKMDAITSGIHCWRVYHKDDSPMTYCIIPHSKKGENFHKGKGYGINNSNKMIRFGKMMAANDPKLQELKYMKTEVWRGRLLDILIDLDSDDSNKMLKFNCPEFDTSQLTQPLDTKNSNNNNNNNGLPSNRTLTRRHSYVGSIGGSGSNRFRPSIALTSTTKSAKERKDAIKLAKHQCNEITIDRLPKTQKWILHFTFEKKGAEIKVRKIPPQWFGKYPEKVSFAI